MAKGRILRITVENCRGGLVENRSRGLIYFGGLATGTRRGSGPSEIRHLRAARLVAREVITGQENAFQCGMIGVHPGVNVGDNALA